MDISTRIDFEIDADDLIEDADSKIKDKIVEVLSGNDLIETALDNFDMTEKISSEVETANENLFDDQLERWLKENPAVIVRVLLQAFTWMAGRQKLVADQENQMITLRNELCTERNEKEFAEKALKESGHPHFQGDN